MASHKVEPSAVVPHERAAAAVARARARGVLAYDLAARIGKHPNILSAWVNGRALPTRSEAASLRNALTTILGEDPGELFPERASCRTVLAEIRRNAGLTVARVAYLMNATEDQVQRWEDGVEEVPDRATREGLASILEEPVDRLFPATRNR